MIDRSTFYIKLKQNDFLPIDEQVKEILYIIMRSNIKIEAINNTLRYEIISENNYLQSPSLLRETTAQYTYLDRQHQRIVSEIEECSLYETILMAINEISDNEREVFIDRYIIRNSVVSTICRLNISQYSYYKSLRFAQEQFINNLKNKKVY